VPEQAHDVPGPPTAELAVLMVGVSGASLWAGREGKPCYLNTDVQAPGAVPVVLAETIDAWEVRTQDGELVAIQLAEAVVRENAALEWVPAVARLLLPADGGESRYELAPGVWEEHSAVNVAFRAPENEAGIRGLLASEEREVRVARRIAELRAELRSRLVMIASGLGMPQKEISDLIGLTPGRVHQLVEDASEPLKLEVADLLADAVEVLQDLARKTIPHELVALPRRRGPEFLEELIALGLVEEAEGGVRRTERGDDAELYLRTSHKRASKRRRSS
jgi:DNA-directed RNA polymerase specialized sigma24 family protein